MVATVYYHSRIEDQMKGIAGRIEADLVDLNFHRIGEYHEPCVVGHVVLPGGQAEVVEIASRGEKDDEEILNVTRQVVLLTDFGVANRLG